MMFCEAPFIHDTRMLYSANIAVWYSASMKSCVRPRVTSDIVFISIVVFSQQSATFVKSSVRLKLHHNELHYNAYCM